jgi:hypothetical protein
MCRPIAINLRHRNKQPLTLIARPGNLLCRMPPAPRAYGFLNDYKHSAP